MGNTIPILILRNDIDDVNQQPADVLYISSDLDIDYASQDGVLNYCRQVAEEWKKSIVANGVKRCWDPRIPFQWHDFANIPTDYLAKHGLRLEHVSMESIITINANDTL